MPHLILESSPDAVQDGERLLRHLVDTLCECETIDPKSVKGRWIVPQAWLLGTGGPSRFVHVTVCLLEGRPESLRSAISDRIYAALREHAPTEDCAITLELREMAPATYRK